MSAITLHDCEMMTLDEAARGNWDVVVVGAGPAGTLAARQLAQRGCRVLLADKKPFPRPKVCGACVNGRALSVLEHAGLGHLLNDLSAVPLDRFRLWCRSRQMAVPLASGAAVSRERFDVALVREAVAAGVSFLPQTIANVGEPSGDARFVSLRSDVARTDVLARVVLVADGLGHPSLADRPEFSCRVARHSRIGAGCALAHSSFEFPRGEIVMAVGRSGYVGIVRLEDGTLNVAAALDPIVVRAEGGLGPAAMSVLLEAGLPVPVALAGSWRGTPRLTRRTAAVAAQRLFLLGDAVGYVEPFTGEGIAGALESAVRLAPLALQATVQWHDKLAAEWTRTYRRVIGHRQWLCRALSLGLRHSALVHVGARLLTLLPTIAQRITDRLNEPAPWVEGCAS